MPERTCGTAYNICTLLRVLAGQLQLRTPQNDEELAHQSYRVSSLGSGPRQVPYNNNLIQRIAGRSNAPTHFKVR